ncbi:hypothetical protein GZ998_05350 [Actinomyces sp. 594]|uniref:hypothetical protein n=1 Tax=Actinomyces sp. 594 TaxID=2057793 RepID=UPI001C5849B9|nr:hypothetical protein [Actinomyces sp. 594]MBW3068938.1 hypothetical protein [Actinomyces sp. 594]
MTVIVPARQFARMVHRTVAVVPDDPLEAPILRCVHAWSDGTHLLMEASDRRRLLRTRTALANADGDGLDAIIPARVLTAACHLIPEPQPVAESDWEDDEAWISTVDPAKSWMVSLDVDGGQVHIAVRNDTTTSVTSTVRPRGEWPDLDRLWARIRPEVGDGPTAWTGTMAADLLALAGDDVTTAPAIVWPSGSTHRPTVMTLGPDTIALLMPAVLDQECDPRDTWPGLLRDDREKADS